MCAIYLKTFSSLVFCEAPFYGSLFFPSLLFPEFCFLSFPLSQSTFTLPIFIAVHLFLSFPHCFKIQFPTVKLLGCCRVFFGGGAGSRGESGIFVLSFSPPPSVFVFSFNISVMDNNVLQKYQLISVSNPL